MSSRSPEAVARDLLPVIESGGCAVWVGAGLSQTLFPSWPALIRALCLACGVEQLPEGTTDPKELIRTAEECKQRDEDSYHAVLSDTFGGAGVNTRDAYQLLVQLPFKRFITTNFDRLLGRAGHVTGQLRQLYYYPDLPKTDSGQPIYYIHGHPRGIENDGTTHFVLSESEFDVAYDPDETFLPSFLEQVLGYESIVFVGCDLGEPSIAETFDRVRRFHERIVENRSQRELPKRFILRPMLAKERVVSGPVKDEVRDYEREREEEEQYGEWEIDVVRYQPFDEQHEGLERVLLELRDLISTRPVPRVSSGEEYPS